MYCRNESDDDGLRDVWLKFEMVVGVWICFGIFTAWMADCGQDGWGGSWWMSPTQSTMVVAGLPGMLSGIGEGGITVSSSWTLSLVIDMSARLRLMISMPIRQYKASVANMDNL